MIAVTATQEDFLVREARESEFELVGEVTYQGFDHHLPGVGAPSPERAKLILDAGARARTGKLLVAVESSTGRIVGTATVLPFGSPLSRQAVEGEYELRLLAVLPEARRAGLGWKLLRSVAELAAEAGAQRLVLDTADFNTGAQGLYERFGFIRRLDRERARPADQVQLHVYTLELAD